MKTDVVVIGSGFGGAVTALRLAEKGYDVTVLEQGRRLGRQDILDALSRTCVERGQTIVLVTHDAKAAAYADRVLVIGDPPGSALGLIEMGPDSPSRGLGGGGIRPSG